MLTRSEVERYLTNSASILPRGAAIVGSPPTVTRLELVSRAAAEALLSASLARIPGYQGSAKTRRSGTWNCGARSPRNTCRDRMGRNGLARCAMSPYSFSMPKAGRLSCAHSARPARTAGEMKLDSNSGCVTIARETRL